MLVIKIKTDSAAFDESAHCEVYRILRDLAKQLEEKPLYQISSLIRDINGNNVGYIAFDKDTMEAREKSLGIDF